MRIFKRDSKVNFVDQKNVFVGYDLTQNCCEHANFYISNHRRTDVDNTISTEDGLEPYVFDKDFFERVEKPYYDEDMKVQKIPHQEEVRKVIIRFRLTAENKPDLYLHLFNAHNGYYSHGFEMGYKKKI